MEYGDMWSDAADSPEEIGAQMHLLIREYALKSRLGQKSVEYSSTTKSFHATTGFVQHDANLMQARDDLVQFGAPLLKQQGCLFSV
jgi:hypothetical protein